MRAFTVFHRLSDIVKHPTAYTSLSQDRIARSCCAFTHQSLRSTTRSYDCCGVRSLRENLYGRSRAVSPSWPRLPRMCARGSNESVRGQPDERRTFSTSRRQGLNSCIRSHCGSWTTWTKRHMSLHPATLNSGLLRKVPLPQQAVLPLPKHQPPDEVRATRRMGTSRLYASEGRSRRGGGKRRANTDTERRANEEEGKEVSVRRSLAELLLHSVTSPYALHDPLHALAPAHYSFTNLFTSRCPSRFNDL